MTSTPDNGLINHHPLIVNNNSGFGVGALRKGPNYILGPFDLCFRGGEGPVDDFYLSGMHSGTTAITEPPKLLAGAFQALLISDIKKSGSHWLVDPGRRRSHHQANPDGHQLDSFR
jgi:hypothetical protein